MVKAKTTTPTIRINPDMIASTKGQPNGVDHV